MTRIAILDAQSPAAFPLKQVKDDLEEVIEVLKSDGALKKNSDSAAILGNYGRARRACGVNPRMGKQAKEEIAISESPQEKLARPAYIRRAVFLAISPDRSSASVEGPPAGASPDPQVEAREANYFSVGRPRGSVLGGRGVCGMVGRLQDALIRLPPH